MKKTLLFLIGSCVACFLQAGENHKGDLTSNVVKHFKCLGDYQSQLVGQVVLAMIKQQLGLPTTPTTPTTLKKTRALSPVSITDVHQQDIVKLSAHVLQREISDQELSEIVKGQQLPAGSFQRIASSTSNSSLQDCGTPDLGETPVKHEFSLRSGKERACSEGCLGEYFFGSVSPSVSGNHRKRAESFDYSSLRIFNPSLIASSGSFEELSSYQDQGIARNKHCLTPPTSPAKSKSPDTKN